MSESSTPLWKQLLAVLLFSIFALLSAWYFLDVFFSLVTEIYSESASVVFDKGAFYFLGIAITASALSFIFAVETLYRKMPSEALTKKIRNIIILGLAIMLLFPHIFNAGLNEYLASKNYIECQGLSYKWLHSQTFVYTKGDDLCSSLVRKKEQDRE